MSENSIVLSPDEQQILTIVQNLPPERKSQILTFVRFVAFETYQTMDLDFLEAADAPGFTDADARWDEIFASDAGQSALDKLADEALEQIRVGKGRSMGFSNDGEIAPL